MEIKKKSSGPVDQRATKLTEEEFLDKLNPQLDVTLAVDQCIDLTDSSDEDMTMAQQPTTAHQVSAGVVHVPQCTQDAGSLNRTLQEPVSVYAQSDIVFRACLQLQKYLIEPIARPSTEGMHQAELLANQCLCAGEAKWADLLRIVQLLPQSRQRFPQQSLAGELAPVTFTTGACARGPNVGITRSMRDYPRVTQVLAMIIQAIDPDHRFSSCTLSLNTGASPHRDSHNARGSNNLLVPCSAFEGGGIWLQNEKGSVRLEADGRLGSVMDVTSPIRFSPSQLFHARHLNNLPVEELVDLTGTQKEVTLASRKEGKAVTAGQLAQQQALEIQERHASKVLADAGCPEFPDYVPSCGGTIADINSGRLTVAATKKLIEGLSPCKEPDADIANALMASFPRTRKGLAGEDLSPKLGSAVAFPGNWFKFAYTAPNRLDAAEASEYLMELSGSLELPLQAARTAFERCLWSEGGIDYAGENLDTQSFRARLNLDMVATVEFLPVQTYGVTPGTSKGVDCATHLELMERVRREVAHFAKVAGADKGNPTVTKDGRGDLIMMLNAGPDKVILKQMVEEAGGKKALKRQAEEEDEDEDEDEEEGEEEEEEETSDEIKAIEAEIKDMREELIDCGISPGQVNTEPEMQDLFKRLNEAKAASLLFVNCQCFDKDTPSACQVFGI
ncbi:unnamed protein product [Symbiodinium microadriaticum]|nr:unnamed protein product [Symbiodinium microadriaticum]